MITEKTNHTLKKENSMIQSHVGIDVKEEKCALFANNDF